MQELCFGVELLEDLASFIIIYVLFKWAKLKFSVLKTFVLLLVITAVETIILLQLQGTVQAWVHNAIIAFTMCLLSVSIKKGLLLFFPAIAALSTVQTLAMSLGYFLGLWHGTYYERTLFGFMSFAILVIIYFFFRKADIIIEYTLLQSISLIIGSLGILLILREMQFFISGQPRIGQMKEIGLIHSAMLATCLLLCILAYSLGNIHMRNRELKVKEQEKEYLLNAQREQIESVVKVEEKLRSLKHDLVSHINAIASFAANDEVARVKDYCNNLLSETYNFTNVSYTGNFAVDGVLGRLKGIANEHGIDIDFDMEIPKEKKVSDYDLCILLSNIISNAIEANDSGGKVDLKTSLFNDKLCIIATNTTNHSLKYRDGVLLSTKRDYETRGFGVQNIQTVVDKYDGSFKIDYDNELVKVEVVV
ncbi:MAG: GHKL domain-containing protein [Pseudobutyrivibrio sp.]|nr:GHKL domain-containing protein [Pseudobutyrivibrio sp.]